MTSATPAWLLEREVGLCTCGCIGRRRKGSYVAKTLNGAAGVMRDAMFADDSATRDGLLQRLDPRVKVLTFFGLLLALASVRSLPVLAGACLAAFVLAGASALSLWSFTKRVWLFVPLFTGVVVLPATLNVVTAGHIVVPLGTWFGHELGITAEGLEGAAIIVTRVAASISLVVLLTLTTSWTKLLAALRALLVPRLFVLVLGMAYRYVFHLLGAASDMYTARRSRTVGEVDARSGRAFVAASAGALFGKAHALSEEVHLAMVARGYTGDARPLSAFRVGAIDVGWTAAAAVVAFALLWFGHVV